MEHLTEDELGWITGFYEGEGSVCCTNSSRKDKYLRVSIAQVDVAPLEFIKQRIGGHIQYKTRALDIDAEYVDPNYVLRTARRADGTFLPKVKHVA